MVSITLVQSTLASVHSGLNQVGSIPHDLSPPGLSPPGLNPPGLNPPGTSGNRSAESLAKYDRIRKVCLRKSKFDAST